jgi:Spy/CpxP family protein refolding chaperone
MVRKALGIGGISALAALLVVSLATAQPGGGGAGGGGGRGGAGGGRMGGMGGMRGDPAQMAGFMLERLGITGDAAKAVEPKLVKVLTLSRELNAGGFGRMGGRGRGGDGATTAPETEVSKARAALQALLPPDNTTAKPEDITKALTAYRAARQKAQADLTTAQADLKKVLTPAQEAQLVLMGQLE